MIRLTLKNLRNISLVIALSFLVCGQSRADDTLERALVKKIEQAKQSLSASEKSILAERRALAKKLSTLEQQVEGLQQKTAAARRVSDESTLSLNQLENRIKTWREQQNYQQNALNRFINQQKLASNPNQLGLPQKLQLIHAHATALQGKLLPEWQPSELIMQSGKIEQVDVLSVGPLNWFIAPQAQQAGLAQKRDAQLESVFVFSNAESQQLSALHSQHTGHLVFDPTMNKAMVREQQSESPWQHLLKGGVWVIPIMLFAVLALTIALYKSFQFIRLHKVQRFTLSHLLKIVGDNDTILLARIKGMQKTLLNIAQDAHTGHLRDDQLFLQLQHDKQQLDRWLTVIGVTASVAPLLGLLGTVSGMIETFKMMTLFGSGDPEVVSGGIAQALITTELGLVVAIPALVLNAMLSRKAKRYYLDLENFAVLLSQLPENTKNAVQKVAA